LVHVPDWLQVVRLLLAFLFTSAAGVHAYALYCNSRMSKPRADLPEVRSALSGTSGDAVRWIFCLYAILFLFTAVLNAVYLLVTAALGSYASGPFKLGTLSLILWASYVIVVFGSGRRIDLPGDGGGPA
jgi:hypothetical protein